MVSSVYNQITDMKNATSQAEAADKAKNGIKNDMTDKNMFLKLMLKQMEYQVKLRKLLLKTELVL